MYMPNYNVWLGHNVPWLYWAEHYLLTPRVAYKQHIKIRKRNVRENSEKQKQIDESVIDAQYIYILYVYTQRF